MNVSQFHVEHLWAIELPAEHPWRSVRDMHYAQYLASGVAVTARHEGRIVACGGVAPVADSAGICWTFMGRDSARHLLALTRISKRLIEVSGCTRVFANTETSFLPGCRWLEFLGFKRLHTFKGYMQREEYLYERAS